MQVLNMINYGALSHQSFYRNTVTLFKDLVSQSDAVREKASALPSYWGEFGLYWTVSYVLPSNEGKLKAWMNQYYQVRSRLGWMIVVQSL